MGIGPNPQPPWVNVLKKYMILLIKKYIYFI
jgi:hypothetical protein